MEKPLYLKGAAGITPQFVLFRNRTNILIETGLFSVKILVNKKEETVENKGILMICNEVLYFITFLTGEMVMERSRKYVN